MSEPLDTVRAAITDWRDGKISPGITLLMIDRAIKPMRKQSQRVLGIATKKDDSAKTGA